MPGVHHFPDGSGTLISFLSHKICRQRTSVSQPGQRRLPDARQEGVIIAISEYRKVTHGKSPPSFNSPFGGAKNIDTHEDSLHSKQSPSAARSMRLLLLRSGQQWVTQRGSSKGAALAFYTLFSMAPILLLVITIVGGVFGSAAAQKEILDQLIALVGPGGADAIRTLVPKLNGSTIGQVPAIIASVVLMIGATSVFTELKGSLDEIWQIPPTDQRGLFGLIRIRLLSLGLILVLAFLLLVSLVVSAALSMLNRYWGDWVEGAIIIGPLSSIISYVVIAIMFAVIFKMLPAKTLPWNDVWIGAVGTAGLFTLGKYAIGMYLSNSAVTSSYGAAGSFMALLLWVYYSSQIFFLGAEFTHEYATNFGSLRPSNQSPGI
jgi:membrane protein